MGMDPSNVMPPIDPQALWNSLFTELIKFRDSLELDSNHKLFTSALGFVTKINCWFVLFDTICTILFVAVDLKNNQVFLCVQSERCFRAFAGITSRTNFPESRKSLSLLKFLSVGDFLKLSYIL